jgi:hypothetical protein
MMNLKARCAQPRLRLVLRLLIITAAAAGLARIAVAVAMDEREQVEVRCREPSLLFTESFDDVTPPALPSGWSSTTWATSNSGVPTPPADTPPNAAFVDDPATISDKQLLSPNITIPCDGGEVRLSFRNNFNLQDGFDGGVLEVSFDDGLTFQDIVAAGGTFERVVTMERSVIAAAIPWPAGRRGPATQADLSRPR